MILEKIVEVIENIERHTFDESEEHYFGNGDSDQLFLKLLNSKSIWNVKHQKQFQDLNK